MRRTCRYTGPCTVPSPVHGGGLGWGQAGTDRTKRANGIQMPDGPAIQKPNLTCSRATPIPAFPRKRGKGLYACGVTIASPFRDSPLPRSRGGLGWGQAETDRTRRPTASRRRHGPPKPGQAFARAAPEPPPSRPSPVNRGRGRPRAAYLSLHRSIYGPLLRARGRVGVGAGRSR